MIEIIVKGIVVILALAIVAFINNKNENKKAIKCAIKMFINDPRLEEVIYQKSFGYITIQRKELGL